MVLRLSDVLALDIVQQGKPEVVAAAENLGRTVRWVHIADIQDIAPLLKGGELLLTSGLGLSLDPAKDIHYVQELARVGVAGVVVTLGWSLSELPRPMIEEAERLHLPLVVLHTPIPFVEVTERVHSEIVNRQYLLLQEAEQLGRSFTELVLHGAGINRIVEELGDILRKPVVVEDAAHQVVKYWNAGPGDEDVLELWESHSRTGHGAGETSTAVKVEEGDPGCAWLDIPLREEPWGRVHVLLSNGRIDEVDKLALDRAATSIALALLSNRDAAQLANNAKGDLIAEIRRGTLSSPEQILRRARALGSDLKGRRIHAMIVDALDFEGYVTSRQLTEPAIQRAKQDMLNLTRKAIIAAGCKAISAVDSDQVQTILGVPTDGSSEDVLTSIADALAEQLPATMGGLTATVGVSRECGVEGLPRAFEEAREAVIYGKSATVPRTLYRFEELGLHRLILRLLELSELPQFVESELGPLLEHDAKSSLKLLPTLHEYLQHGGNKSSTAKAVHLERRSLYHRLDKISRLLDADLEDAETRTRLFVALKSLDVVRRAPGRSVVSPR
jgi:purine catabolism regulator